MPHVHTKRKLEWMEINTAAIRMIINKLLRIFEIFIKILKNEPDYDDDIDPKSLTIFNWSMGSFYKRMQERDMSYIYDLHVRRQETLCITKLLAGLQSYIFYLKVILNEDIKNAFMQINDAAQYVSLEMELQTQITMNSKERNELLNKYKSTLFRVKLKRTPEEYKKAHPRPSADLENGMLINSISIRYQINHLSEFVQGINYRSQKQMDEIVKQSSMMNMNKTQLQATNEFTFGLIELYKGQIEYWTWRFNNDYEEIESEVNRSRILVLNVERDMETLRLRITFFHEELERMKHRAEMAQQRKFMQLQARKSRRRTNISKKSNKSLVNI